MTDGRIGSVYIRDNPWYRLVNVVKVGVSSSTKDRNSTYITSEPIAGEYIRIYEIPINYMPLLDKCIKSHFKQYNIYNKPGGTEFYSRCIIDLIEPYLSVSNIKYKTLSPDEILLINRCDRIRNIPNVDKIIEIFNKLTVGKVRNFYKNKVKKEKEKEAMVLLDKCEKITPNEHQKFVLDRINDFYAINDIGKILWACGLGKALLGVLIVKELNFKTIVFGVPSNNLQKQISDEILKIFPIKKNILFVGGEDSGGIKSSTDKQYILQFINGKHESGPKFIVTTYHSCHLLVDANIAVDLKIGDEAHHLVGIGKIEERGFRLFHKIISKKTLFMTATEKTIENQVDKEHYYSMGDDETIFGKEIDVKTVKWAIDNKKITDYSVLVLKNKQADVEKIISSCFPDKRIPTEKNTLFVSCYMCAKSFKRYKDLTHILLYTNTTEDSELAKTYIDIILALDEFNEIRTGMYNNAIHSKNSSNLNAEVYKFKDALRGIISCVYIFGEGFDLPKLNAVCIAGNMRSETRIVQYILRPNRLEKGNPYKKAYVIIPYIDYDLESYEKLRQIISRLRNVDETIEQKIRILTKPQPVKKDNLSGEFNVLTEAEVEGEDDALFEDNGDELKNIKLRLIYSKSLGSKSTEEEDEYNYIRSINSTLKIESPEEYIKSEHTHSEFIKNPEEYFTSKGVWRNWYDFIGFDTLKFIQTKQQWVEFCKEKNIKSLDGYYELCKECENLPKDPGRFYVDFTNMSNELRFNSRRR